MNKINDDILDFSEFKLTEKQKNDFKIKIEIEIEKMISEDPYLLNFVRNLKKDEIYYNSSLPQIYDYVKNYNICKNCSKKFGECLKENKYQYVGIKKDEDLKRYSNFTSLCEVFEKINDSFKNNVTITTMEYSKMYEYFLTFKNKISENSLTFKQYNLLLLKIYKILSAYKNNEDTKGLVIKNTLSSSSIVYVFIAAIKLAVFDLNLKVSYIDFESNMFESLNEKDNYFYYSNKYFEEAINTDILFINNFDYIPKYSVNFNNNYLLKLMKKRATNKFLTFINLKEDIDLNTLLHKKFKDDIFQQASSYFVKMFSNNGYILNCKEII